MPSLESVVLLVIAVVSLAAAYFLGQQSSVQAPSPAPPPPAPPPKPAEKAEEPEEKDSETQRRRPVMKAEHAHEEDEEYITQVSSRSDLDKALQKARAEHAARTGEHQAAPPKAEKPVEKPAEKPVEKPAEKPARQAERVDLDPPTIEAPTELPVRVTEDVVSADYTQPIALFLVTAIGRTDTGRKRARNEDTYLEMPKHHLWAVADGMGGHAAGEVASQLAVSVVQEAFETGTFGGESNEDLPPRGDELVRAIKKANAAVHRQAQSNPQQAGMGTTFVSARFSPNKSRVYVAHVGDSRCYRLRERELKQLTRDHTLGVALGIKGKAAGKLLRAVGTEDSVDVDLVVDEPRPGDYYILCSDGLTRMVKDEEITSILREEPDLKRATARLIVSANEHGGVDNVTVIVVHVQTIADASASA